MLLSMFAPPGAPSPEELLKFYAENSGMNHAIVKDGVIVNTVVWDRVNPYTPPEGCEIYQWDGHMSTGWAWVDGAPVDPDPPLPPPSEAPMIPSEGPAVL
jgi:hypothetical protein